MEDLMGYNEEIVFQCKGISKSFFGNIVLENMDLQCKKGHILSLVGENGAGKSTIANIISANLKPDAGELIYFGKRTRYNTPMEARKNGVVVIHQLLSLIPELSVGENIMLGAEPRSKFNCIDNKKTHEQAKKILDYIYPNIDVFSTVSELTPAEKQMVEISRAWCSKPRLLILDEPTSSLSTNEVEHLFTILEKLKQEGVSIILITHRLEEIFKISDEIVVLKDGQLVLETHTRDVDKEGVINAMVGREVSHAFPERPEFISEEIILELRDVCLTGRLHKINLKIPKGSIIGIAGLEGHGQRYLARGLFGIERFDSGEVLFKGNHISLKSPSKAMSCGFAFVSDDRDLEGLVKPLSVLQNMIVASLGKLSKLGIINKKKARASANEAVRILSIKIASLDSEVVYLSGGNQQKVIFSKWIKTEPEILILHEPTKGIDVQTRLEIYQLLRELTLTGVSVVLISSDMLELIGLCDEINVIYEGSLMGSLRGKDATEEKIMKLCSGLTG